MASYAGSINLALGVFCEMVGDKGYWWGSKSAVEGEIQRRGGLSASTSRRALEALVALGVVEPVQGRPQHGFSRTCWWLRISGARIVDDQQTQGVRLAGSDE